MTIQECLAKNIKFYRRKKNITQSQLAELCETSTNYIATIETCRKYPSPKVLEKIAKVFEIEAIDLFQIQNKNTDTQISKLERIKEELKNEITKIIIEIVK